MVRFSRSVLLGAIAALLGTGCSQLSERLEGPASTAAAPAAQMAPRVISPGIHAVPAVVLGDSLTVQAADAIAARVPGIHIDAEAGRTLVVPALTDDGLGRVPELRAIDAAWFVVALGTNDSTFAGYPLEQQRSDVLAVLQAIGADRCIAWILPHAETPRTPMEIARTDTFRDLIDELVATLPCHRILDWRAVAEAEPPVMASDGVHLSPVGIERFADLIAFAAG